MKHNSINQNFIFCWKYLVIYNITIKITHRVNIKDRYIWEEISLMKVFWVGQSVFYEVLNAASDDVFKRKCFFFNGEAMFYLEFKKDTEKVLLFCH